MLYVYYLSIPGFSYKNSYNETSFAGFENNVILGEGFFMDSCNRQDIKTIKENSPIYILTSHSNYKKERIMPLLEELEAHGHLELVYDNFETNVYYYKESEYIPEENPQM